MEQKERVRVVAALIWEQGKFFICQRPKNKTRGLLWEFVGGKTEAGEHDEEALKRECAEELGAEIEVGKRYMEVTHEYPDLIVTLIVYEAKFLTRPNLLEHNAFAWISPDEIERYDFCPADFPVLHNLKLTSSPF